MQQRGLDRNHHTGFQRALRIKGIVRHRAGIGEPRRFMAHESHAVSEKLVVIVQFRLLQNRFGRRIDFGPVHAGADRPEGGLLDRLDLGEKIFKLGVGFAGDAHARQIADIAVIVAP